MGSIKVFMILVSTVMVSFVITAILTESFIAPFVVAFISLVCAASIIWKIDFGTWNCFK